MYWMLSSKLSLSPTLLFGHSLGKTPCLVFQGYQVGGNLLSLQTRHHSLAADASVLNHRLTGNDDVLTCGGPAVAHANPYRHCKVQGSFENLN
jgi:hypothetical protein